jgi:hypothetical protein
MFNIVFLTVPCKEGGVNEEGLGSADNPSLLDIDKCLNKNLVEGVNFNSIPEAGLGLTGSFTCKCSSTIDAQ